MLTKLENFSKHHQRTCDTNDFDQLIKNYCQYLNQNKQENCSFFPYFEKRIFSFLLENPSLYSNPLSPQFFFDCLKSIFKSHIDHISLADFQKLFHYLDEVESFSETGLEQKSAHVKLGCELLKELLARQNEGTGEHIAWLRENIISNLREASFYYLRSLLGLCADKFYPLLMQVISLDFDKFYEKEIIEFIVKARTHFGRSAGTDYIFLFNRLFEQQKYDLILKLYQSSSSELQKEIRWVVSFSDPIPSILKEIVPIKETFVIKDIKNAILCGSPLMIKELIEKKFYVETNVFYDLLSKKVLELGKTDLWYEKLENYLYDSKRHVSCRHTGFHKFTEGLRRHYHDRLKISEPLAIYEFPDNVSAQYLPSGLYIAIANAKNTIPASFSLFAEHFQKVNANNNDRYQIDFNYFLITRIDKIINLYGVMGDNAFLFMKKMIKTSVQNLARYFEHLNYIPTAYWPLLEGLASDTRREQIKIYPSGYDRLISFISDLESFRNELPPAAEKALFQEGNPNYLTILEQFTHSSASISEVEQFLKQTLQTAYKRLLLLPDDINVDLSIFDRTPSLFLRLLTGRQQLKTPLLQRLFDRCIEQDLRPDVNFNDFADSLSQEDEFGRSLAEHNQAILSVLRDAKINTDLAFDYPVEKAFSCIVREGIDWEGIAKAIYADLVHLSSHLTGEEKTLDKIRTVINQVTKGSSPNFKPIYNGSLNKNLSEINQQLTLLLAQGNNSSETIEFATHFQEHYKNLCQQTQNTSLKKTKQQESKNFHVKVWDKNQIETFILGDYLSCCLAPDGGQFRAIVQRRMDKAMMMHVVYGEELNEPVCGNWLFFAKNKLFPNQIFVVANFFEIRSGYAHNGLLRDQLVQQLLDFTGSYAKAIGAQGFLLRPLTYGMIPDFKGKYELKAIQIEKLGGFFSLSADEFSAEDFYYLDALDSDHFYLYEAPAAQLEASWARMFTAKTLPSSNQEVHESEELLTENRGY